MSFRLSVAVVLLTLSACATPNPQDNQSSWEGAFAVQARVGEAAVPGELSLMLHDGRLHGRVTFELSRPLHFALRADTTLGSERRFATSAPGRGLSMSLSGDSLRGELELGPGRVFAISGVRSPELWSDAERSSLEYALFGLHPWAPGTAGRGTVFPAVTPDGSRFFWGHYTEDLAHVTLWTAASDGGLPGPAERVAFPDSVSVRSTAVLPDGSGLVIASTAPLPGERATGDYNLWIAPLGPDGLPVDARPLQRLNSPLDEYQPSLAADGTLYFVSNREGGLGGQDLYRASFESGVWLEPRNLGSPVNTEGDEMSVLVSPDGTRILFSSATPREGHLGNDDLYLSRREAGAWTVPRNAGSPVNTFANEYGAALLPDGTVLFASDRVPPATIYRVAPGQIPGWSPER